MSDRDARALREQIADALAYNDECGPGPVSRTEYLADADAILALVGQPVSDRRMVDLDAVMEGNRNVARNIAKRLYRVGFPEAAAEVESLLHEFGGSANQPADDRRMVDRIVAWLRNPPGGADDVDLAYALRIEREFGGSASSEDQP